MNAMSARTQLAVVPNQPANLSMWQEKTSLQLVKDTYGKNLTNMEWNMFMQMGLATGLNPFLKEIWAVKYKDFPAQVFIGRDGYRKSAQRHPAYDFHTVDAVYENDEFSQENGVVKHKYQLKNRGKCVGAYCITKRKGSSQPTFVYVEMAEYNTGQSLWKRADAEAYKDRGKPVTMIKKVAEAQCLRAVFQELFAGTYHEYEQWDANHAGEPERVVKQTAKGIAGLEAKFGLLDTSDTIEAEYESAAVAGVAATVEHVRWLIDNAGDMADLEQVKLKAKTLSAADKALIRDDYKAKEIFLAQGAKLQEAMRT
jgi:phage recombination protein Bet